MKNCLLLAVLVLGALTTLQAQDPAVFNHYVQSPILLNPAAAGFDDEYRVMLNTRAAWSGFEDAPRTLAVRANGPIGESFGIGFTFLTESAAQLNRNKGQIDVSFKVGFGRDANGTPAFEGGFGFFTEFQRQTLDGDIINNPQYEAGDEEILAYLDGKNRFDGGFGFYGAYRENTFGGVTVNNLIRNRLEEISKRANNNGLNFTLLLGHNFALDGSDVKITPSLMMRNIQGAPFMLDVNVQASFLEDQFMAGLSLRNQFEPGLDRTNTNALGLLLGTRQKGFQLYYSFDLGFGGFQQYSNGSHELTIGYAITRQQLNTARERRAIQNSSL